MKHELRNHPEYIYRNLLVKFAQGEPLSTDELHYLDWFEKHLSNSLIDPITKYYLKIYRQNHAGLHSFLLPHEILNKDGIEQLKKKIQQRVKEKNSSVEFTLTNQQFLQLKTITYHELILYHGNHFLTGAPYHPGGIPHVVFFQWGNLFGVAKYVIMAEEKALKSNILIYVEDMQERFLERCIQEYSHQHADELKPAIHLQHGLENKPAITAKTEPEYKHSPFSTPTLSLSKNRDDKKDT